MRAERVRNALSLTLLFCLLIGLIAFAVLIIRGLTTAAKPGMVTAVQESGTVPGTNESRHTAFGNDDHIHTVDHVTSEDVKEDDAPPNYVIQLNLGTDNSSSGQVYIQYEDRLGFVCSDGFRDNEARVVCRELGYKRGIKYDLLGYMASTLVQLCRDARFFMIEQDPQLNCPQGLVRLDRTIDIPHTDWRRYTDLEPILSGLHCTGSESHIKDCGGFDLDVNVTSCSWFAAVVCYNGQSPYELRLINKRDQDSGLVEMKMGGVWGVLCAIRTFDDELADILCRNMNYTGGITMDRGISGEVTNTKVWVPYIYCDVGEPVKKTIFECKLILHTDNILKDRFDFRSNRYRNEYMACLDKPNSHAAAVHCLNMK